MDIVSELRLYVDESKVKDYMRFFKCGKGEYGEGDQFLGVNVPSQRKIAKACCYEVSFEDIQSLLENKYHECRLTALFMLVYRFEKADDEERREIYEFYMKNLQYVNNWDLVDTTTPNIMGEYMWEHSEEREKIKELVRSKDLWRRRMAVLATFAFIKRGHFTQSLYVAQMLLTDSHDLIHKAVGWMLREVGKKNQLAEEKFLERYVSDMPRTMLRYAIERFSQEKRKYYMDK